MSAYSKLELTPGERNSFLGDPDIGFVKDFPLTLYRAVGKYRVPGPPAGGNRKEITHTKPGGRFWFDAALFWGLRRAIASHGTPDADREYLLRWLLRDQLAICRDWNSIDSIYCLHLTHGPLYAARGRAKSQPLDSKVGA